MQFRGTAFVSDSELSAASLIDADEVDASERCG